MKNPYKRVTANGKRVYEHRYVMEQYLGRELLPSEFVHHINGDRHDNRIENLQVMTSAEHTKKHLQKYPNTRHCIVCGKEFSINDAAHGRNITCSKECFYKLVQEKNGSPVAQYSMDGRLLKTWQSISEISRVMGYSRGTISECCHHKRDSIHGFRWEFSEVTNG